MSCGNPHATPCDQVLLRLHEFLDHEDDMLDGLSVHEIEHHLEECPPCLRQFGIEQMVRSLVQRSCGCHGGGCDCGCMPTGDLRARIVTQLTTLVHDHGTGTHEHRVVAASQEIIERHMGRGPGQAG